MHVFVNCYKIAIVYCRVFLKLFGRLWIHISTRRWVIPPEDFFSVPRVKYLDGTAIGLDHFPLCPLEFVIRVSFGAVVQYNMIY
jgi:hypothetical protein